MATTTNLDTLKINYLTQAQYDAALENNEIDENQLYLTPSTDLDIVDLIYPVGSIYMSVNSASPATLFGGTWVQIKDTFLLAAGDTYASGATGGEATHSLTVSEIPSHSHKVPGSVFRWINKTANVASGSSLRMFSEDNNLYTGDAGGGGAHNNMPPYLTVYMWKRTA